MSQEPITEHTLTQLPAGATESKFLWEHGGTTFELTVYVEGHTRFFRLAEFAGIDQPLLRVAETWCLSLPAGK